MFSTFERLLRVSTRRVVVAIGGVSIVVMAPVSARAQQPPQQPTTTQEDDGPIRIRLPTIIVRAEKDPEYVQETPVSVTAVPRETLDNAGVRSVSEAAQFAPNTFFNEFSARKLSNARFRGIGSSPNNPAVTTFIDGVP